ncbi:MAG TPA: FAD-dependent oxidoreductase, partial [Ilumatobacteraceae bacterium]|nr:FAD-dependent oxidoreductase [Ilumatobacteraceae bacterium]
WIHGTEGNPVTALARRFGLPTVFVGGDSTFTGGWEALDLRAAGGARLDGATKLASVLAADAMWDALDVMRRERLATGDPDISLREALGILQADGLVPHDPATLDWHLELLAREDAGSGSERLSLFAHDEGVDVYGYGDSVIAAGFGALAERMAAGIDVRLSSPVVRVDTTGDHAIVATADASYDADIVVVTVPIGVLKRGAIEFVPELPARKQRAIERIGVGVLAKLVLRFDEVWWPEDQYVVGIASSAVSQTPTMIINATATHREPVLVVLAGGELGRWVEAAEFDVVKDWVNALLASVFGGDVATPLRIDRTQWSTDPNACGSYSAMTVGTSAADRVELAEPVGRIHFAGEATSASGWSTTHGAVTSGRREAARISGDPSITADRFIAETRRWRRQQQRVMRFHNAVSSMLSADELVRRLAVLRLNAAFDDVPERDLEALASMFEQRHAEAGELICRSGETATEVFVVADGEAAIVLGDGKQAATIDHGHVVGELGLFSHRQRTADVVALGDCTILALDYERFRRFLLAFPEAALAMLGTSIEQLVAGQRSDHQVAD